MHSRIITQYTKDQLQLVAMHIGEATQGDESTAPISMFHLAFFNSIIDKHQHMHLFTFNNVLV